MDRSGSCQISIIILFCILVYAVPAYAEKIQERLANGITVTAEFNQGDNAKPAILFIHGFLQTPYYQTSLSLIETISAENYTVLAPTLSLGIDRRKKSLPCEAVHAHTMQSDIDEIAYWVDWLNSKGHKNIIIVGHSYGSLHALVYASENPDKNIKKIIATSLVDFEHAIGEKNIRDQIERAQQLVREDNTTPGEFQISYCKKYVAPAEAFLSYARWLKPKILETLTTVKVPVIVIIGGDDQRMGADWPKTLRDNNAQVIIIDGANHFFGAEYEFDLLDRVLGSIQQQD